MGASQEVKFKIGGDTASLERSFAKLPAMAEAAGRKAENAFQRASRYSAGAKLSAFREKQQYDDASTVGKIKQTTGQLADLAYARARSEKGSAEYLKIQLEIEQRLVNLRKLQRTAQKERADGVTLPNQPSSPQEEQGDKPNRGAQAFRVIGTAIAAGLRVFSSYLDTRLAKSQAQDDSRAAGLQSLRSTFAARRGSLGELEQGRGTLSDLESKRNFEANRVSELSSAAQLAAASVDEANPFGKSGFKPLQEAEANVEKLNAEIQKQHNLNQLIERDLHQQAANLVAQDDLQTNIAAMKAEGRYSDVAGAQAEADRLATLYEVDIQDKRLFQDTPEANKRFLEVAQAQNEANSARRSLERRQVDVNEALTQDAAGGRTFQNGARRPRSEAERLAERAERFRQRARDAVLTGNSDSGRLLGEAVIEEGNVGSRLAANANGKAPKGTEDATSLKPELATANKLLEAIKQALSPTKVQ